MADPIHFKQGEFGAESETQNATPARIVPW
jgi:hypothetical protein